MVKLMPEATVFGDLFSSMSDVIGKRKPLATKDEGVTISPKCFVSFPQEGKKRVKPKVVYLTPKKALRDAIAKKCFARPEDENEIELHYVIRVFNSGGATVRLVYSNAIGSFVIASIDASTVVV